MTTLTSPEVLNPSASVDQQRSTSHARIGLARITGVELRKMFDTRSGFWLMASIGITALLATGVVILLAPDDQLTYDNFAGAIGIPMTILLPVIAILSVTSEWSQRTGLATFAFVPLRARVITAKLLSAVGVAVVSMMLAAAVGAVGNTVGAAVNGKDPVWDLSLGHFATIVVANVLGLLVGFMLGVLIRNSAGAVVAYFVYAFVLPSLTMLLAASQAWFKDLQPWVDFNYAQSVLFDHVPNAEQWANLATAGGLWLVLPLAVGLRLVLRSEIK